MQKRELTFVVVAVLLSLVLLFLTAWSAQFLVRELSDAVAGGPTSGGADVHFNLEGARALVP